MASQAHRMEKNILNGSSLCVPLLSISPYSMHGDLEVKEAYLLSCSSPWIGTSSGTQLEKTLSLVANLCSLHLPQSLTPSLFPFLLLPQEVKFSSPCIPLNSTLDEVVRMSSQLSWVHYLQNNKIFKIIYLLGANMSKVSDFSFPLYFISKDWFGSSVCSWPQKYSVYEQGKISLQAHQCICWLNCLLCFSASRSWAHFVHRFFA